MLTCDAICIGWVALFPQSTIFEIPPLPCSESSSPISARDVQKYFLGASERRTPRGFHPCFTNEGLSATLATVRACPFHGGGTTACKENLVLPLSFSVSLLDYRHLYSVFVIIKVTFQSQLQVEKYVSQVFRTPFRAL